MMEVLKKRGNLSWELILLTCFQKLVEKSLLYPVIFFWRRSSTVELSMTIIALEKVYNNNLSVHVRGSLLSKNKNGKFWGRKFLSGIFLSREWLYYSLLLTFGKRFCKLVWVAQRLRRLWHNKRAHKAGNRKNWVCCSRTPGERWCEQKLLN